MPTIISHAAVPLALGIGLGEKRIPRGLLIAGVIASMLPDADVIMFRFGATYDDIWSHRGFSHSIGFALLLGVLAALLFRRKAQPLAAFAFVAFSATSHGLLDMLTDGGHGIAILWPLNDHRYFFDWRPIRVAPLDLSRFPARAAAIVLTEAMWIWLPAILTGFGLRAWCHRQA